MITPQIPSEDLARQLTYEELSEAVEAAAAEGPVTVCSVSVDAPAALRADLGASRSDVFMRELLQLVRRNLRGTDAVAIKDSEIVVQIACAENGASSAAQRVVFAARTHAFLSGSAELPVKVSLSVGLATSPGGGTSLDELLRAARGARAQAGSDSIAVASKSAPRPLDLRRFVGRAEALAVLNGCLDDMARGAGRVVAVIGDVGAGKSGLVRSLEPQIRLRGGSLVVAKCRDSAFASPYALWTDVLHGIRRLPVKSTREWPELSALESSSDAETAPQAHGGSKTQLLEEITDFLRLAAQQRPLVVLLENLERSDSASWDALEYLHTHLESERIVLVLTFRSGDAADEAVERWHRLATRTRYHDIRLTRLTRDDVKRWLEAVTRTSDVAREAVAYVYRYCEGNPLLLNQLMRDLVEGGQLVFRDGSWQWSDLSRLPPPTSFEDTLIRRIARLPGPALSLLEVASIVNRGIAGSFLLTTAGITSQREETLRLLCETGMLATTFDREASAYVAGHSEIARVVRESLTEQRRLYLHTRVAEELAVSQRGSAAEIARHFELGGDKNQSHRYALQAAERAIAVYETTAVAQMLAMAERTAPTERSLAEVRVRMASVAEEVGRYEDAEALCDQALEWYDAQGERLQALRLKRTRALMRMKRGQGAQETLNELVELERDAVEAHADMERAAILLLMAQTHWRLGDLRAAQQMGHEALDIAERGDDRELLVDACNRYAVTIQLENPQRARELLARSLEITTSLGDTFRRVRALNNIGVLEMIQGSEEAWRFLKSAVEQARAAGMIEQWGRAELNLGALAGRLGDYNEAARAFGEALRLTAMLQNGEEELYATYNLAHLERDNGRLPEALDMYQLVVELAERIGQVPIEAGGFAGLGLCHFHLGDFQKARVALTKAEGLSERLGDWFTGREFVVALGLHLLILDGETRRAVSLLESSINVADAVDASGAAWLTAEFGALLQPHDPTVIAAAVKRYENHLDVRRNPKMRRLFAVLKANT